MEDSDAHSHDHLCRETGNLALREPAVHADGLQPGWGPLCLKQVDSEESAHKQAYNQGAHSEEGHQTVHLAQAAASHLVFEHQTRDDENDTVTCVSHTHGEEQQEERCQNRSRVEFTVGWQTVHSGEHLEIPCKPVVAYLDRRIVVHTCRVAYPEQVASVESLCKFLVLGSRSETRDYRDMTFGGFFGAGCCKVAVQIGSLAPEAFPDVVQIVVLQRKQFAFLGNHFSIQLVDTALGLLHGKSRSCTFSHRETVFGIGRGECDEPDIVLVLIDFHNGPFIFPLSLVLFCRNFVPSYLQVLDPKEFVAVIRAPRLHFGKCLSGNCKFALESIQPVHCHKGIASLATLDDCF